MNKAKQKESDHIESLAISEVTKFSYVNGKRKLLLDNVIAEQPLQIRLLWDDTGTGITHSRVFSITMRTPGNDEELIIGLLLSEGVIRSLTDITEIVNEPSETSAKKNQSNQWEVKLIADITPQFDSLERYQVTYSSCGLCGTTSLKSLEMKNPPKLEQDEHWLSVDTVYALPELMRAAQQSFTRTGGVHAAANFTAQGVLIDCREDIGRHNALDKLFGALSVKQRNKQASKQIQKPIHKHVTIQENEHISLDELTVDTMIVLVSGRVSFEIVQKTLMAGVSVLVAIGAPSDLAILAAKRFDLTLIGFASKDSFNVYHGEWRLRSLEDVCRKI